jgi:hypothetical protein
VCGLKRGERVRTRDATTVPVRVSDGIPEPRRSWPGGDRGLASDAFVDDCLGTEPLRLKYRDFRVVVVGE